MEELENVLDDILRRVQSAENVWSAFQTECAAYHSRSAGTLAELRARDDKKKHGDLWELFCLRYLRVHLNVRAAWLLKDVPAVVLDRLSLGRSDMGIDIVAVGADGSDWAVQCKWRAPDSKKRTYISWAHLATFYALVARTGPYAKQMVCTNAAGARRVGLQTPGDETHGSPKFSQIPRDAWVRMIRAPPTAATAEVPRHVQDVEKIREARLRFFDSNAALNLINI